LYTENNKIQIFFSR